MQACRHTHTHLQYVLVHSSVITPPPQDVSDRIEKETPTSLVVQSLERNAQQVVRRDWMNTIGEELRQGGCSTRGRG